MTPLVLGLRARRYEEMARASRDLHYWRGRWPLAVESRMARHEFTLARIDTELHAAEGREREGA